MWFLFMVSSFEVLNILLPVTDYIGLHHIIRGSNLYSSLDSILAYYILLYVIYDAYYLQWC